MAGSNVYGFAVPTGATNVSDVPDAVAAAINALESYLVGRFTGTSDRNTKFPSPPAGLFGFNAATGRMEYYDGNAYGPLADLAAVTSGTGNPYSGSSRPSVTARIVDADTKVVTTGGSGTFTLTYTNPFPSVVESVVVTIADGGDGNAPLPIPSQVILNKDFSDTTKVTGRILFSNGTSLSNGQLIRLNYVAVGQ